MGLLFLRVSPCKIHPKSPFLGHRPKMKVIVELHFLCLFIGMDQTKKSPEEFWSDLFFQIFTAYQKIRPWIPILTAKIWLILTLSYIELGNCFYIIALLMSFRAHSYIITAQFKKFHVQRLKNVTMPKFQSNRESQFWK